MVGNRLHLGREDTFDRAIQELEEQNLLFREVDEYKGTGYYAFSSPWSVGGHRYRYDFWRCAAGFLYDAHGIGIDDWIKGLDFSIFDRVATPGRVVPWR